MSVPNKPEPLAWGPLRTMRTEPGFTGWVLCVCKGCGKRGRVNKGLLRKGQHSIESCVECRNV